MSQLAPFGLNFEGLRKALTSISSQKTDPSFYYYYYYYYHHHHYYYYFNVYLFLREKERQSVSRGGAEREGDTESKAGSRL